MFCECLNLESVTLPNSITSVGDHAFTGCCLLSSIVIPDSTVFSNAAFVGSINTVFIGCDILEAKASSVGMSVEDYYRVSHQTSIKLRVTLLKSLLVYQERMENETPALRGTFAIEEGHLNSPLAYRMITAFELWREICMFL